MQLGYNINMPVAFAGLIADATNIMVDSLQALETTGLGLAVCIRSGLPNAGRLPRNNKSTLVFAGDLIASNVFNVNVNGVAISPVTFSGTHAATMTLIITAIKAVAGVANAVLDTADTNSRTIIVTSVDGTDLSMDTPVVTAGNTQTTATIAAIFSDIIHGITASSFAREMAINTMIVAYQATEPMSVLRKGKIWCVSETVVNVNDPVYVRFIENGAGFLRGQLRNDSDSGKAKLLTDAVWRTNTTATNSLAIVEINKP